MTKTKKTTKSTVSSSNRKPGNKEYGWGIDPEKYAAARKKK